jgi:PAS domain S-box-containing protein
MPFWIDLRITPVRNDDGVVTHYVGISSDVTDLIEMRQELLQNERRLRLSQEYAGIGTWDWEISTGNLFWSAEIARMLGFTQDFRAATYESFRQAVHPEDREAFEDAIAECLKTGNRYVKEFRCIRADGTVIWLLGAGNVTYDASGRPDHLLGIGQDITERKQRETEILRQQQFQKVLADSAADFVSVGRVLRGRPKQHCPCLPRRPHCHPYARVAP